MTLPDRITDIVNERVEAALGGVPDGFNDLWRGVCRELALVQDCDQIDTATIYLIVNDIIYWYLHPMRLAEDREEIESFIQRCVRDEVAEYYGFLPAPAPPLELVLREFWQNHTGESDMNKWTICEYTNKWFRLYRLIRQRYREGQEDQLGALGLVVNAVVLWNTRYLDVALMQARASGMVVKPEDVERLSPLLLDHVNVLGRYEFVLTKSVRQGKLRPLRDPKKTDDLAA
jgi:hypothetical protein